MNSELIRRWNDRVEEDDAVLHFGDFCWSNKYRNAEYYRQQLNGRITFINGSHDNRHDIKSLIDSCKIVIGGISFHCSHKPEYKYTYNLCGHVHEKWRTERRGNRYAINVGVDVWNYYPISIVNILKEITRNKAK
jgi:calcineurin-like phosphoesterase family protein